MAYTLRTKYILITSLIGLVAFVFITLYAHLFVYNDQKSYLAEVFKHRVEILQNGIEQESIPDSLLNEEFVRRLKNYPFIIYLALKTDQGLHIYPENYIRFNQVLEKESGAIFDYQDKEILATVIPVLNKRMSRMNKLYAGLDASKIVQDYRNSQHRIFVVFFIFLIITYFAITIFERRFYAPLMRLKNRLERLAQGEPLTSSMENGQLEFIEIDQGMYNISQSMMRISKENTTLNEAVEKKVRDIRNSRVRLGNELEFMYSLALLPMELKGEEETGTILNKLNGILTQTIKYHISMVFLKEGNYYKYHSSRVKDMQIISNKLNEECKNYLIPAEIVNPKGKILFSPSTTVKPHFSKILDKLNLAGLYAQLPIPNIGLLVVGYIDQQGSFTKEELRRLQIVTNIIAFSIENLEAISVLKRSIKFRTTELETTNQLLMDTLQDKDDMIKLVSHDLKAPLRNVSGLVDSIYRKYSGSLDEDFLNRLERIKNNVQKEKQMIEEILTSFKTLEKGDTVENLNVYAILESIQRDLQYDLGRKNISFDLDKNLPKINSNPYIVEHVFLNLIDNAIKNFQDDDENSWIKISAFTTTSDVTFTVEDNGLGIPEDKQDEVFKAYSRGSEQYERDTSGFGLGLALTKSLVEKVGGKIEFESKVGKGTKFFITFKK